MADYKLDGSDDIRPVPFDAHEQVVRSTHTHSPKEGYQKAEHKHQEFPKVVAHDKETGVSVVVKNVDEEKAYRKSKVKAEADAE